MSDRQQVFWGALLWAGVAAFFGVALWLNWWTK